MNPAQKFNDEVQKALETTKFEVEFPADWLRSAKYALNHASPMSLGITGKQFKELAQSNTSVYSLYDFAILSNNLEKTTASQMNMAMGQYWNMVVDTNNLTDQWNTIVDKIKAEITAKIVLEQKTLEKLAVNNNGSFKPLKAEA